jgi:DNA-directed RNA polymerase subunit omega
MARITVEDCLEKESNRFSLVRLAAIRAKELLLGDKPVTDTKGNKAIVSALREIADGKVSVQLHRLPVEQMVLQKMPPFKRVLLAPLKKLKRTTLYSSL